jgi:hypothetical protein
VLGRGGLAACRQPRNVHTQPREATDNHLTGQAIPQWAVSPESMDYGEMLTTRPRSRRPQQGRLIGSAGARSALCGERSGKGCNHHQLRVR